MKKFAEPKALQNSGPYSQHKVFKEFSEVSKRSLRLFKDRFESNVGGGETPSQHLITRMMYIAEVTSVSIRLVGSYALSHSGMSLLRDRYEQTVRFSYLAHQSDNHELVKYIASHYAKANKVYQGLSDHQKSELAKMKVEFPSWMVESPTKEQKEYLNRWNALDLFSMAKKRDALSQKTGNFLFKESMADLYGTIYQQLSSVTHYDMYGMNLLDIHRAPDGALVLAPDPWWPMMLTSFNALFDLVQAAEATTWYLEDNNVEDFRPLYQKWHSANKEFTS